MINSIRQQILASFSGLIFEPIHHKYMYEGVSMTPVTKVVDSYSEEFDTELRAREYALRHGGDPSEIAAEWKAYGKERADLGTRVHLFAENYFYNHKITPSDGFERAVVKFWKEKPSHIIPVMSENRVFTKEYRYAGTSDNLFYDMKKRGLIITDYKTNKDIHKNFAGKRMLPPFHIMLDTPFNHYQIQLSMYQIPLEDIGLRVLSRLVVWLKSNGTYEILKTTDYTKELRLSLN